MSNFKSMLLGSFDGLHSGHRILFEQCLHPFAVLLIVNIPRKKEFIFPINERIKQINYCYRPAHIFVFDVMKKNLTGKQFLKDILLPYQLSEIVVGDNFTFGSDQLSASYLSMACEQLKIIPIGKDGVSSSSIKTYLSLGQVDKANNLLSNCFFYEGKVIHGEMIARQLGCPTANFLIPNKQVRILSGSYISVTLYNGKFYDSITFFGKSKTHTSQQKWHGENHLLNQNIDLYNQKISVYCLKFIRENQQFSSINLLKKNINNDLRICRNFFKQNPVCQSLLHWKIFNL